jgi:glycosyltransferase involved in cell wall biosynthesis
LRVGMFCGYYAPHVGGYCKNVHELARRLVERGHSVDVITTRSESSPQEEVLDGVRIIRLPLLLHIGQVIPVPTLSVLLTGIMQQCRYEVVVSHTRIFATSVLGAVYSRSFRVPLIHVERGSCHSVVMNRAVCKAIEVYDHLFGQGIMSRASRTVGISEKACAFVKHLYPRAHPLLIHNGITIPDLPQKGSGNRKIRIVFTGRVIYAKGVQDLIRAFSSLTHLGDLELFIVGDGIYLSDLRKQAWDLPAGVRERIMFAGEVPQETIYGILATCDIFVNPSYSEGLPTVVMEAAAAGMPIIATNVGGTDEIIKDRVSGWLVEPHNVRQLTIALDWMIRNQPQAYLMGQTARQAAQNFDWDKIVDQWEEMLEHLGKERAQERAERITAAASRRNAGSGLR